MFYPRAEAWLRLMSSECPQGSIAVTADVHGELVRLFDVLHGPKLNLEQIKHPETVQLRFRGHPLMRV